MAIDQADDLLVDQAAQDHFDHIHGFAVGDAHTIDEFRFLPNLFEDFADLWTTTVHHHRVHTHEFHQHNIPGETTFEFLIHHGITAILDNHGLALKPLDKWQGLT